MPHASDVERMLTGKTPRKYPLPSIGMLEKR